MGGHVASGLGGFVGFGKIRPHDADLRDADLRQADLAEASLRGTVLTGARVLASDLKSYTLDAAQQRALRVE